MSAGSREGGKEGRGGGRGRRREQVRAGAGAGSEVLERIDPKCVVPRADPKRGRPGVPVVVAALGSWGEPSDAVPVPGRGTPVDRSPVVAGVGPATTGAAPGLAVAEAVTGTEEATAPIWGAGAGAGREEGAPPGIKGARFAGPPLADPRPGAPSGLPPSPRLLLLLLLLRAAALPLALPWRPACSATATSTPLSPATAPTSGPATILTLDRPVLCTFSTSSLPRTAASLRLASADGESLGVGSRGCHEPGTGPDASGDDSTGRGRRPWVPRASTPATVPPKGPGPGPGPGAPGPRGAAAYMDGEGPGPGTAPTAPAPAASPARGRRPPHMADVMWATGGGSRAADAAREGGILHV